MKKMSVTITLALLLVLMLGSTIAYALFNWDGDPIFKVEGTTVKVLVSADEVCDPSEISVVLSVPEGVEAWEVSSHGFDCEVVQDPGIADGTVEVTVLVPKAKPAFDVRVTVQVPKYGISEYGDGRTGRPIKVKVEIPND